MFSAYVPSYLYRPRPYRALERTARPLERSGSVVPVTLDSAEHPTSRGERKLEIGCIMEEQIIAVNPGMRLEDLGRLFVEKKMSGFPVVDTQGELLGLVSQSDLINSMVNTPQECDTGYYISNYVNFADQFAVLPGGRVRDIMTPYLYYATPDTDVREVIDLMLKHHIHRIIITEARQLRGIVTTSMLLRVLRDLL